MSTPSKAMTHRYIDERSVAERYVENRLAPEERADFKAHLANCDECGDRVQLARLFLEQQQLIVDHTQTEQAAHPEVIRPPKPEPASKEQRPREQPARPGAKYSIIIEPNPEPVIPIPEEIHEPSPAEDTGPWTARFVAQFRPWQLAVVLAIAGLLLLLVPTLYFLTELARIREGR